MSGNIKNTFNIDGIPVKCDAVNNFDYLCKGVSNQAAQILQQNPDITDGKLGNNLPNLKLDKQFLQSSHAYENPESYTQDDLQKNEDLFESLGGIEVVGVAGVLLLALGIKNLLDRRVTEKNCEKILRRICKKNPFKENLYINENNEIIFENACDVIKVIVDIKLKKLNPNNINRGLVRVEDGKIIFYYIVRTSQGKNFMRSYDLINRKLIKGVKETHEDYKALVDTETKK